MSTCSLPIFRKRHLFQLFASSLLLSVVPSVSMAASPTVAHEKFTRQSAGASLRQTTKSSYGDAVVVNAASYLPGISPGGLVTIFGHNLTDVNGIVLAGTDPFPDQLAGVSVLINGIYAPIFGVAYANGEDQISVQVPYSTATGPGSAEVQVYNHSTLVADLITDSFVEDPGIFIYNGTYAVAVRYDDGSLVGPNNPAHPGDILTVYTTGLGPLSENLTDGYGAPSNPLAYTVDPFQMDVNGQQVEVLFSGLAPGFVGLYQLNVRLPRNLPFGTLNMQIYSQYANSGVALLPVD
jgi:uncharacterized protein (TIGR03437 family)